MCGRAPVWLAGVRFLARTPCHRGQAKPRGLSFVSPAGRDLRGPCHVPILLPLSPSNAHAATLVWGHLPDACSYRLDVNGTDEAQTCKGHTGPLQLSTVEPRAARSSRACPHGPGSPSPSSPLYIPFHPPSPPEPLRRQALSAASSGRPPGLPRLQKASGLLDWSSSHPQGEGFVRNHPSQRPCLPPRSGNQDKKTTFTGHL